MENYDQLRKDLKLTAYFIIAALSPNYLVSLFCVFLYIFTLFPELKGPFSKFVSGLFSSVKAKANGTEDDSNSEANSNDFS